MSFKNHFIMEKSQRLFLAILISFFCNYVLGNTLSFKFEEFRLNNKLPSGSVFRMYHDSDGFIWLGTSDGLCRYDGYDLKTFRSSSATPQILKNNEIQCLAEDNHKRIWVGMQGGVNIIDKNSFTITSFDNKFIDNDKVNCILSDKNGNIWIGTSNNGLLKVNTETYEFEHYSKDQTSKLPLRNNSIINLYEDKQGRIWFTSWKSEMGFISKDRKTVNYAPKIGVYNNPFRIFQDKIGDIWVCTWGDGVYKLKVENNSSMTFTPIIIESENSNAGKMVYSITQDDKFGYIWMISTNGLLILEETARGKYHVVDNNNFIQNYNSTLFHDIIKDRKGNLWLGSISEGAFRLEFKVNAINYFPAMDNELSTIKQANVTNACILNNNTFLLGVNSVGLFRFDSNLGKYTQLPKTDENGWRNIFTILKIRSRNEVWLTSQGEDFIRVFTFDTKYNLNYSFKIPLLNQGNAKDNSIIKLYEDSNSKVWIGSYNALYIRSKNGNLQIIPQIKSANSFTEDRMHNIWIGTDNNGLYKYCKQKINNKIIYYIEKVKIPGSRLENTSIRVVYTCRDGKVYIGTKEGYIYVLGTNNELTEISSKYGITDEKIQDFNEDVYGTLWITTSKKVIRYNPKTHTAIYYSNSDGINLTNLYKGASVLTSNNLLLIGGNNGLCTVNINKLKHTNKPKVYHVYVTDLFVENKSVFSNDKFGKYNADKSQLTAKYTDNNIRIEFSALDYTATSKIQYAYKLSGVNNNWIYTGNDNRSVNYANLPAGNYRFLVKASDENGLWSNDITTIQIRILPPLYLTWWAYLIYITFLIFAVLVSIRIAYNRIRLKNQLSISIIEKEKAEELNQVKIRYFTNISHELLTPLTIIMLQIEALQNKVSSERQLFDTMKENVTRLKRLISQILVFRKTENGNIKLSVVKNDIVAFVKNICISNFRPLIIDKQIDFRTDIEYDQYMAYFDPDKLDKIIYNLLSNAFKYTSQHGTIVVKISFVPRNDIILMRLSVADNGSGISEEDLPNVFKRFYISNSSDQSQSHGIGLALTKELVGLHKGNIQVKSQLNEGTVFTIEIPVSQNAYGNEDKSEDYISSVNDSSLYDNDDIEIVKSELDEEHLTILIVEDNCELNEMIVARFSDKYIVFSAKNGIEALNILREKDVDLIISDVMMPEMDGLTLCKVIKNDLNTSHVSILMLTAKNSTEDRIDCYNAGADAYISKPFEMAVLYARVRNLISRKKQKIESFQHNHEINVSSMEYSSLDEVFLKQAISVVEQHLDNDTFDFDLFADKMLTSKATLHRKIKNLTDLAPVEFIKNIRMKHAIQMFDNNAGNISEVAYAVGFNDPKYFSKCFKAEFGITPRDYISKKEVDPAD